MFNELLITNNILHKIFNNLYFAGKGNDNRN